LTEEPTIMVNILTTAPTVSTTDDPNTLTLTPTLGATTDSATPTQPPAPETSEPSPTDDEASSATDCSALDRTDAIFFVLFDLTEPNLLDNPLTPQGQAFRWIWLNDVRQLDPCESEAFRQRYALAVLYHSTRGDEWTDSTGWLSEAHECSWYGVTCDEESMTVTSIDLGMAFMNCLCLYIHDGPLSTSFVLTIVFTGTSTQKKTFWLVSSPKKSKP
jgi:hypothetical protein